MRDATAAAAGVVRGFAPLGVTGGGVVRIVTGSGTVDVGGPVGMGIAGVVGKAGVVATAGGAVGAGVVVVDPTGFPVTGGANGGAVGVVGAGIADGGWETPLPSREMVIFASLISAVKSSIRIFASFMSLCNTPI